MCPNTASPEWIALATGLNSAADAHTAWVLNGNSIPTIEQAEQILKNLKTEERDEQLSRSSDAFKLQRAVEQRISLETMKYRGNVAQ
jgi:GTPase SAR1 family protein